MVQIKAFLHLVLRNLCISHSYFMVLLVEQHMDGLGLLTIKQVTCAKISQDFPIFRRDQANHQSVRCIKWIYEPI